MRPKINFVLLLTVLVIILLFFANLRSFTLVGQRNFITRVDLKSRNILSEPWVIETVFHDPLFINNNSDLIKQAKEEEWVGNGSLSNPYLIAGLNISGLGNLVTVRNTNLNFQIINCIISNGNGDGVVLINVTNGAIVNTTISSNARDGISLYEQTGKNSLMNISIVNNSIFNNNNNGIFFNIVFVKISSIKIENNIIYNNGNNGIYLHADDEYYPIHHCLIANNRVSNNSGYGIILVANCHNNTIISNLISHNSEAGIYLDDYNHYNNITRNTVVQNGGIGIDLDDSFNYTITDNFVTHGIRLCESDSGNDIGRYIHSRISVLNNNTVSGGIEIAHVFRDKNGPYIDRISNNEVYGGRGISLYSTQHSMIANNTVYNATEVGIYSTTNHSTFSNNLIYNCREEGMYLDNSINNTISNNTFYNNNFFGLRLLSTTRNKIYWNDFIGNSLAGEAQAQDDYLSGGVTNSFTQNFWYDWMEPDSNSDTFIDTPYLIDIYLTRAPPNQDSYPLTHPNRPFHYLTRPRIFFPIEDDPTYPGRITLKWIHAVDFFNHSISYTVYYSFNQGNSWTLIVENLSNNSYMWIPPLVSSNIDTNRNLVIKVVARCSDGLTAEDITDNSYLITYTGSPENKVFGWIFCLIFPSIILLLAFRRIKR
ncbi:MAG: right-handed parallel beta-helix repeat-containing protein [Candidatus Thorarchaeota archaeon]